MSDYLFTPNLLYVCKSFLLLTHAIKTFIETFLLRAQNLCFMGIKTDNNDLVGLGEVLYIFRSTSL